jgi:hypothetical protein
MVTIGGRGPSRGRAATDAVVARHALAHGARPVRPAGARDTDDAGSFAAASVRRRGRARRRDADDAAPAPPPGTASPPRGSRGRAPPTGARAPAPGRQMT